MQMQNHITLAEIRDIVEGRGAGKEAPRAGDSLKPIAIPWESTARTENELRLRPLDVTQGEDGTEVILEVCYGDEGIGGRLIISGPAAGVRIFQAPETNFPAQLAGVFMDKRDLPALVIGYGDEKAFLFRPDRGMAVLVLPRKEREGETLLGHSSVKNHWEFRLNVVKDTPGFVATSRSFVPPPRAR